MNDLKDLFELALTDDAGAGSHGRTASNPASDLSSDPVADIERGRKLLARRTHRRMLGGAVVTAVAVAAASFAVLPGGASGPARTQVGAGSAPTTKAAQQATVKLVAYTGAQPPGYTVTVIPAGWVIQGSNPYALVIAPANAPNKDPDVFIGKLVVSQGLFQPAGSSANGWAPVHMPGHTAYYSVQNGGGTMTAGLQIEKTANDWLSIQAPTSLGWTKQQMIQFGQGVTVLGTAQESKG
jgi:hypothetical protein